MLCRFRTKVTFKVKLGSGFPELLRVLLSVLSAFSFISLPKVYFIVPLLLLFTFPVCTFVKTKKKKETNRNKTPASANKLL